MPRASLNSATVIEAGAQLLDEVGPAGFSLAALAERLGVRAPSLYKHTDGLPGLRRGIMLRSKLELATALGQAAIGLSGDDAFRAAAYAYRRWALAHPGQYPATQQPPAAGDTEDEEASAALLTVIERVLVSYGLGGEDAVHGIRFLRSSIHGFLALETTGGFGLPVDIEESYARMVDGVISALERWKP